MSTTRRPPFRRGTAVTLGELVGRLRRALGARGMPPLQLEDGIKAVFDLARLEDPGYADEPTFWIAAGGSTAAALRFPQIYMIGLAPRTTIDGVIVSAIGAAQNYGMYRAGTNSAGTRKAHATNRTATTGIAAAAQAAVTEGVDAAAVSVAAVGRIFRQLVSVPLVVPLLERLGPPDLVNGVNETVYAEGEAAASTIFATWFGREWQA